MQYTLSLLKQKIKGGQKSRKTQGCSNKRRQNNQEDHQFNTNPVVLLFFCLHCTHCTHLFTHPFGLPAWLKPSKLPRQDMSGQAMDQRRGRGSHATGAGTGAPPRGIYSRPALKGQDRGHACFPFHSQATSTRPHMLVLNIFLNTGSNIVGAQNRRQWVLLEQKEDIKEGFR